MSEAGTDRLNNYECQKMVGQHVESIDDVNDLTRAVSQELNEVRNDGGGDVRVVVAVSDGGRDGE